MFHTILRGTQPHYRPATESSNPPTPDQTKQTTKHQAQQPRLKLINFPAHTAHQYHDHPIDTPQPPQPTNQPTISTTPTPAHSPTFHIPSPTFPTVTSRTHTRSNNNDDNNDKRTTTMTTMTTTTTTMAIAVRSVAACSTQRPSLPPSQLTHSLVPSQLTSITHSLILTLTHLVSSIAVNLHLLGSDKTSRCYYNGSGQWKTFCRIVGYVAVQALDATRDVSMNGNIKNGK